MSKYTCPPQKASGADTFADNIVGLQIVQGGGLTQGNFEFSSSVLEKVNRSFDTGVFSQPISLKNLNIPNVAKAQDIFDVNFKVYPNFDETNVLSFVGYGPLNKRFSAAVTNIINYFPAAIEISQNRPNFKTGTTATNIIYDSVEDITTLDINIGTIRNPFGIDFTTLATQNLSKLDYEVSKYRNLSAYFIDYVLQVSSTTYYLVDLIPSNSLTDGTLSITVKGSPFGTASTSYDYLIIRPNDFVVNEVFNLNLDEVEEILLNRFVTPIYTATFQVPTEADDGSFFIKYQTITWPLNGKWNLDISTLSFTNYLNNLEKLATSFDEFRTDLVARFYITDSFKEFDTIDTKISKVLKIYGRSFDETKKYVDSISHMVSVNYNVGDDVPSKLLVNFAETIGWSTNISPIQNNSFLTTLYGTTSNSFDGQSQGKSLDELNYQYYRNLILNSAYLFKSKGTRKSIEFLMKNIGAPDALLEFNENVYLADEKIPMSKFDNLYSNILGGTYTTQLPVLDPLNVYRFNGAPYTAYTVSSTVEDVSLTITDYPIDSEGYPKAPDDTDDFYFQKGEGWFESTPQHRSPEIINQSSSVFTGQNFNIQTSLEPFTYGQKYLDRFINFPYLGTGFELLKTNDNKKSWTNTELGIRESFNANYDALYEVSDDRLVLNVKNVELFLNPAQALAYDVWYLSNTKSYPIPITGLSSPYPQTGGTDWTVINPRPQLQPFYEFYRTFWHNMINVRNRQFSSDGKTSGYPTLQSLFWKYLTMYEDVGIENDGFSYQKMIDYINGIGDFWIRLVEQFIPATTIWNTGTKFENSIFHRQKFIYRPQRGCLPIQVEYSGPQVGGGVSEDICLTSDVYLAAGYDLNYLQESLGLIAVQYKNFSFQYGFQLVVFKAGVPHFFYYTDPSVYYSPNYIIEGTAWDNMINQGLNYLMGELAAIGVGATYTGSFIVLNSYDCVEIDSYSTFGIQFYNITS